MDDFANDTPEHRDEAFQEAAARLGISKAIIEKDFWVCWSLKRLFALPSFGDQIIFKGGTSLSKAYDVIHRFSEDVDLSLDRKKLGFVGERDPGSPGLSGRKRKTLLQELQDTAEEVVSGLLMAEIQSTFDGNLKHEFSIKADPDDAQTLLFSYPSIAGISGGYIKPIVKFEFGARGVHLPVETKKIVPFVSEAFPDLFGIETVNVKVLGVERTFWEKATILHMLYHQDTAKPLAARMSRHYYDMAQLLGSNAKKSSLERIELLNLVAHHKSVFFKAAWANYENAKPGSLRLLPNAYLETGLRADYVGMDEMIMGDAPSFDDILGIIGAFEAEVNV